LRIEEGPSASRREKIKAGNRKKNRREGIKDGDKKERKLGRKCWIVYIYIYIYIHAVDERCGR
jgi:hypothetical protein